MDQREQYEQYLKILSIFHYVVGGISALFACFPALCNGDCVFRARPCSEFGRLRASFLSCLPLWAIFCDNCRKLHSFGMGICDMHGDSGILSRCEKALHFLFGHGWYRMYLSSLWDGALGVFTIIALMQPQVKEMFPFGQTVQSDA